MDKKTVFTKTAKGDSDGANLSSDLKRILSLVDSKSTVDELAKRAPPSLRAGCRDILGELEQGGYICDKNRPFTEPKIATPKFNPLKMFSSKGANTNTGLSKTERGEKEEANLPSDLKRILSLIDDRSTADELAKRVPPSMRDNCKDLINELLAGGYIRDNSRPFADPKVVSSKSSPVKMFVPVPTEELDFNTTSTAPIPNAAELAAKLKSEEAAQLEAAVEAAKLRANAEAMAKAEAQAKQEAENAARAKALADAEAAAKAEAKAKKEAEIAARAKAVEEANAKREAEKRAEAGAKAKQEALARMQAEQEAARNKAALEAAMRVRAEIEAAARAQQVAEAKARQETVARLQAEEDAARSKAALEAAAKAKAESDRRIRAEIEAAARAQQEAEAKAKREAEDARLKVELEAARIKAELEMAAKAKREAEAALLKAEQEASRVRAELAAAKARAEAEAKARAEAEARARAEAEARARAEAEARVRAEAEARVRAEAEAEAKARAEAEAKARAESEAKARAETEARARAEVEANIRAEAQAKALADALAKQLQEEAVAALEAEEFAKRAAAIMEQDALLRSAKATVTPFQAPPAFEINLDEFTGVAPPENKKNYQVTQLGAQNNVAEEQEAEQSAVEPKVEADSPLTNVAAEMARLKEESEAVRRKVEEEARRQVEEQSLAEEQAKAWAEAEQRAKAQAILEIEQAAQQAAVSQAKSQQQPAYRARSKPLPWGKIVFSLILLAVIGILALPYVYPLEEYIVPLEQQLSAQMKQPVHIGAISASSIPPKLQLQKVNLGNAQEVKVGTIVLSFDPLSLFSDVKVISDADLQDVSIEGRFLDKQVASLKLMGANGMYPVRHLTLQRVKIVTDEVALPTISGIADIDDHGVFSRLALHSADDKLGIDLRPNQGRWQIGLSLKENSLFFMPDVVFSDLSAKGDLADGEVNFTEFDAHIFNGILLGSAKLNWRKGWQLQGQLEAKTFELNKMFPKYGVEGDMYGEGTFSFSGAKLSQLDDSPHLEGSFSVKSGTVNGFDMVETARVLSTENMVGGRTHFDDLIGLVEFDNHVCHFRQLKIGSNMLMASGSFDVSATNQLSGNFNAEIKMRSGNNPLVLYGALAGAKLRAR